MKAKLVMICKTVIVAAGVAGLHTLAENAPQLAAILPPKYAGFGAVLVGVAASYLAESPRKVN